MTLNYSQLSSVLEALKELQERKMSFKLSLIIAKNIEKLELEEAFYIRQEQEFAPKYLSRDEEGKFIQTSNNTFQIIPELLDECIEARKELDAFSIDIDLRMIPVSYIEDMDFTPAQVKGLSLIINEEE